MIKSPLGTHRLLILDMDLTLAIPHDVSFYNQYGDKVVEAISEYFNTSAHRAFSMTQFYRKHYDGGEQALFRGDAHLHFPDVEQKPKDYALLHAKLSEIDTNNIFYSAS